MQPSRTPAPKALGRMPVIATGLVAIAAAVLTAVATHDVALDLGVANTSALAWLVPVIVEFGSTTAALLAWSRTRRGLGAAPERMALFALMALSVWVNVSHVGGSAPLGWVLAAAPPVVLVCSVELLLRAMRTATAPVAVAAPETAPAPVAEDRSLVGTAPTAPVDTSAPSTAPAPVVVKSGTAEVAPTTAPTVDRASVEIAPRVEDRSAPVVVKSGTAEAAPSGETAPVTEERSSGVAAPTVEERSAPAPETAPRAATAPVVETAPTATAPAVERVAEWLSTDPTITGAEVARRLECSAGYGRKVLAKARALAETEAESAPRLRAVE